MIQTAVSTNAQNSGVKPSLKRPRLACSEHSDGMHPLVVLGPTESFDSDDPQPPLVSADSSNSNTACPLPILIDVPCVAFKQVCEPCVATKANLVEVCSSQMIGPCLSTALFVELCAGSAGLSAAVHRRGPETIGFDWQRNAAKSFKAPVAQADLTVPSGQQLVTDILKQGHVQAMHAAPPCGTASRSRDRPVAKHLVRAGAPDPRPLRSENRPEGLPNLTSVEQARVTAANAIYAFILNCVHLMHASGKFWIVENPLTSYLWSIPGWAALVRAPGVFSCEFQHCMHGGTRPVWRRWSLNVGKQAR